MEGCLVITPGNLVERWQDELRQTFGPNFVLLTQEGIAAARGGTPCAERSSLIARLDRPARREGHQAPVWATDWDLVITDQAPKRSTHCLSGEVKATRRYQVERPAGLRLVGPEDGLPHPGRSTRPAPGGCR